MHFSHLEAGKARKDFFSQSLPANYMGELYKSSLTWFGHTLCFPVKIFTYS